MLGISFMAEAIHRLSQEVSVAHEEITNSDSS